MIPKQLRDEKFRFCKVGSNKRPTERKWEFPNHDGNYSYNNQSLQRHISSGGAYGAVTGFNKLFVIDFDNDWIYQRLKDHLPETFVIKSGGKSLHYYYFIDDASSFNMRRDTGNEDKNGKKIYETLIDFQGEGKQVICAGSIHSSGKKYEVHEDLPINSITKSQLNQIIKKKIPSFFWPNHLKERPTKSEDSVVNRIKNEVKIQDYDPSLSMGSQCCPFHSDHKPSFSVFDDGRAFYCFTGCGGGDIFNYVRLKEKCDFVTAKNILTKKIEIENVQSTMGSGIRSLKNIREVGFPELKWRAHNLVPEKGITILGGASGSYKTWCAMQLALACSSGNDFLDYFKVNKCNVLYVDEENGEITLPNRFEMLIKGHSLKENFDNLQISIFNNLKLDSMEVSGRLKEIVNRHNIKLIVIDSMVRCMIGEEDRAKDVRVVFENLKLVFQELDVAFVILHHTTKGGKGINSLRGSGDFAAFADVVLMFNTNHKGIVNVEVAKNRHVDLSEFPRFCFQISGDKGKMNLRQVEYTKSNYSVIEDCKKDLLDYFEENETKAFRTGEMRKEMEKMGHKKNAFSAALNILQDDDNILKKGHGKYVVKEKIEIIEEFIQ